MEIRTSRVTKILGEYALGRGLFACRVFEANELITIYGGELVHTRSRAALVSRPG